MYPVNQVILGGDPLFNGIDDIDVQIQKMEAYKKRLQQLKSQANNPSQEYIWDEIDKEVSPLTEEQKSRMLSDVEYADNYGRLQDIVQAELLNLVKAKIESTCMGKELLQNQLRIVRKLKSKIVEETTKEMEMFNKFREYSKHNPGITYEEFVKLSM